MGPTTRRCPLLGGVRTITDRDRQFPDCAMAVADATQHSPSRCLREIGGYAVIGAARQHQPVPDVDDEVSRVGK